MKRGFGSKKEQAAAMRKMRGAKTPDKVTRTVPNRKAALSSKNRGAAYRFRPEAEPLHAYEWNEFTSGDADLQELRSIEKDTGIKTSDLVERALEQGYTATVHGREVHYPDFDAQIVELVGRLHEAGYHTYLRDGLALYDDQAVKAHAARQQEAWEARSAKNRAAYDSAHPKPEGFDGRRLLGAYRGPGEIYSRKALKTALIQTTSNWKNLTKGQRQEQLEAAIRYVEDEVGWTASNTRGD
jgi:hypothetical protein